MLPGVSLAIQERGVGVFVVDMCAATTGQQAVSTGLVDFV